jgi:hypothetical protein
MVESKVQGARPPMRGEDAPGDRGVGHEAVVEGNHDRLARQSGPVPVVVDVLEADDLVAVAVEGVHLTGEDLRGDVELCVRRSRPGVSDHVVHQNRNRSPVRARAAVGAVVARHSDWEVVAMRFSLGPGGGSLGGGAGLANGAASLVLAAPETSTTGRTRMMTVQRNS